jgi:hypothetical protein
MKILGSALNILVREPEGMKPLGKTRYMWVDSVESLLNEESAFPPVMKTSW